MNGFEVFFVIIIGSLAMYQASWITSILYFLSGYQFVAAKKFTPARLENRKRNIKVISGVLLLVITFKVLVMVLTDEKYKKEQDHQEYKRYMESIGIVVEKHIKGESSRFHYNYFMTFFFEICMICIMIAYYCMNSKIISNIL